MNSPTPQRRTRTPGRRKENRDGAQEWSIGMAHRMEHRMLQERMWVVLVARRWRVARSLCHHLSRLTRNHGVPPHPYSTWNNGSWYSICGARWKIRSTVTYSCTNASTCCMRHFPSWAKMSDVCKAFCPADSERDAQWRSRRRNF
jgi:hypothetical protein